MGILRVKEGSSSKGYNIGMLYAWKLFWTIFNRGALNYKIKKKENLS